MAGSRNVVFDAVSRSWNRYDWKPRCVNATYDLFFGIRYSKYDQLWAFKCSAYGFTILLVFSIKFSYCLKKKRENFIICLTRWAGKMNQILRCDWLPERARWSYLARSGTRRVPKENVFESHKINPLLTKFVRSRWLDIGLVLFLRAYGPWRTPSWSINTQNKELGKCTSILTSHLVNNPYIKYRRYPIFQAKIVKAITLRPFQLE